jgi:hypothetical protein
MADAITTVNPVKSTFVVNKYSDIDEGRVAQDTPRGRLCFRDTNGRFTLPTTLAQARKAVFPVDHAKPLNPPPYFDGPGLNGNPIYGVNDGSYDVQGTGFEFDPDQAFQIPWPAAIKVYDLPPSLYNVSVTSGNKILAYDEGTFTFGSGNYSGGIQDYHPATLVYADYVSGNNGKITISGAEAGGVSVGHVEYVDLFGKNTVTVKLKGHNAL